MIFYFSATGNCKYVASRLAANTQEKMISITECIQNKEFTFILSQEESIGLISPTYAWGLPSIVCEFLEKLNLEFEKAPYAYFVATYGTTPGQTGYFANRYMEPKGVVFHSMFSVKMPDTWTPVFDLSKLEKVNRINGLAESEISYMIEKISNRECGDFMKRKVPRFAAKAMYKVGYNFIRKTNKFHVEDNCITCGLCEKSCPANAIKIQNEKPIWVKNKCVMCFGCLHRCPKFSIQYGGNTKKHGQYTNPNVKM